MPSLLRALITFLFGNLFVAHDETILLISVGGGFVLVLATGVSRGAAFSGCIVLFITTGSFDSLLVLEREKKNDKTRQLIGLGFLDESAQRNLRHGMTLFELQLRRRLH
jgi:hypothetical protein